MSPRGLGLVVLAATLLLPSPCSANPISIDQSYIPSPPPDGFIIEATQTVAQTFTVGLSGMLTALDLELGCCRFGPPSDDLLVEVRSTLSDGFPSNQVLASTVLHPADIPVDSFAFVRAALGPHGFSVSPGELLSIVLSSSAPSLEGGGTQPYAWFTTDGPGTYDRGTTFVDRGSGFQAAGTDMGFKTYVGLSEVPEPPGLPFLAVLLLTLSVRRSLNSPSRTSG